VTGSLPVICIYIARENRALFFSFSSSSSLSLPVKSNCPCVGIVCTLQFCTLHLCGWRTSRSKCSQRKTEPGLVGEVKCAVMRPLCIGLAPEQWIVSRLHCTHSGLKIAASSKKKKLASTDADMPCTRRRVSLLACQLPSSLHTYKKREKQIKISIRRHCMNAKKLTPLPDCLSRFMPTLPH
jgi:hypothetical protein